MASNFIEIEIKCPYFKIIQVTKGNSGYGITCEGIDVAQFNTTRFETAQKRKSYIERHCMQYPNSCPIAAAISQKYDE